MEKTNKIIRWLMGLSLILLAVRFLSLPWVLLTDTTEARYAEIGRIIAESGNFITPMLDGAPFWAKPPLAFWVTAISYKIFGINTFAAHLPQFLFLVGIAALLYFFVRRWRGELTGASATTILLIMPAFVFMASGVMTDPALTFCITLCMVSFYNAIFSKEKFWGYLFFVGLGFGLLAKGPLILVLVGLPIFVWTLFKNKWRDICRCIPWITGTLLMIAIALPWYIMAELESPGFLNYFIIGEHFERYITHNWNGDLYGRGRGGFIGKIWLYYILAILPWSIWLAFQRLCNIKLFRDEFVFYAAAFTFAPLVFFTFSQNIVPAYVLSAMAPTAILIAIIMGDKINLKLFKWLTGIGAALWIIAMAAQIVYPKWSADLGISDRYFISKYASVKNEFSPLLLYKVRNYSAEFYSNAQKVNFEFAHDEKQLHEYATFSKEFFILLRQRDLPELESMELKITPITTGKKMTLVKIN
jgi:4-amino-4-deoxy-L-arabinose transferase-like glycosyltransferase